MDILIILTILYTLYSEHIEHCIGWSIDNIGFGMGGALLQRLDRDTQQWAMKCSAALINGRWD